MICKKCSKRLQPDWLFCPLCACEIVVSDDERLSASGVTYFPDAFAPDWYKIAQSFVESEPFYHAFMCYVLSVVAHRAQLAKFHTNVTLEVYRALGSNNRLIPIEVESILWCALSLATDRYFAEKALIYDWSAAEEEEIRSGWYDLMAPVFIPNSTMVPAQAQTIAHWVEKFQTLHKRDVAPLANCARCTSQCDFQYEVSKITEDNKVRTEYRDWLNRTDFSTADETALFSRLLTQRLIEIDNVDLQYCLAIHLIRILDAPVPVVERLLSHDAQVVLASDIRSILDPAKSVHQSVAVDRGGSEVRTQVFDSIVKLALAGAPWREVCAEPMQELKITVEEVEAEVQFRKSE